MARVLLSHAAADAEAAATLAVALEEAGHQVSAGRPGDTDPQTALTRCDVAVLLVTPEALASQQLTAEVVGASERGVPIVPVLSGVSHLDLTTHQPAWRNAIGSATAIEVPAAGLDAILPRLVAGVGSVAARSPGGPETPTRARRRVAVVAGVVAVALAVAAGTWWALRDQDGGRSATRPTTATSGTPSPTSPDTSPGTTAPVADAASTPVQSVAGNLRITRVRLATRFCAGPSGQDCAVAPSGERLVVLRVVGWDGQPLPYTEELAHQMDQAYVRSGARSAGFTKAQQTPDQNGWEIAYTAVPADAASADLLLRWPGNPTLLLHPVRG